MASLNFCLFYLLSSDLSNNLYYNYKQKGHFLRKIFVNLQEFIKMTTLN